MKTTTENVNIFSELEKELMHNLSSGKIDCVRIASDSYCPEISFSVEKGLGRTFLEDWGKLSYLFYNLEDENIVFGSQVNFTNSRAQLDKYLILVDFELVDFFPKQQLLNVSDLQKFLTNKLLENDSLFEDKVIKELYKYKKSDSFFEYNHFLYELILRFGDAKFCNKNSEIATYLSELLKDIIVRHLRKDSEDGSRETLSNLFEFVSKEIKSGDRYYKVNADLILSPDYLTEYFSNIILADDAIGTVVNLITSLRDILEKNHLNCDKEILLGLKQSMKNFFSNKKYPMSLRSLERFLELFGSGFAEIFADVELLEVQFPGGFSGLNETKHFFLENQNCNADLLIKFLESLPKSVKVKFKRTNKFLDTLKIKMACYSLCSEVQNTSSPVLSPDVELNLNEYCLIKTFPKLLSELRKVFVHLKESESFELRTESEQNDICLVLDTIDKVHEQSEKFNLYLDSLFPYFSDILKKKQNTVD